MTNLEKRMFDSANDCVDKIENNGKIVAPFTENFIKFGMITDKNDLIFPVWRKWIESICFSKRYSIDEEDYIPKVFVKYSTSPILTISWRRYPTFTMDGNNFVVTARLNISRSKLSGNFHE